MGVVVVWFWEAGVFWGSGDVLGSVVGLWECKHAQKT